MRVEQIGHSKEIFMWLIKNFEFFPIGNKFRIEIISFLRFCNYGPIYSFISLISVKI